MLQDIPSAVLWPLSVIILLLSEIFHALVRCHGSQPAIYVQIQLSSILSHDINFSVKTQSLQISRQSTNTLTSLHTSRSFSRQHFQGLHLYSSADAQRTYLHRSVIRAATPVDLVRSVYCDTSSRYSSRRPCSRSVYCDTSSANKSYKHYIIRS